MAKLDTIEDDSAIATLSHDDIVAVRRQLAEGQTLLRDTVDRLRQTQEENEMHLRRRDELEARISSLEAEYEELLGSYTPRIKACLYVDAMSIHSQRRPFMTKKSAMWTLPSPWPNSR